MQYSKTEQGQLRETLSSRTAAHWFISLQVLQQQLVTWFMVPIIQITIQRKKPAKQTGKQTQPTLPKNQEPGQLSLLVSG